MDAIEIDRQFYSKVPKNITKQIYDTIYAKDFEMLGYGYPQNTLTWVMIDDVEQYITNVHPSINVLCFMSI